MPVAVAAAGSPTAAHQPVAARSPSVVRMLAGRRSQDRPPQLAVDSRQVGARAPAREDARDPLRGHGRVERPALARDRRHHDHLVTRPQHAPQGRAPLVQRLAQQPAAIEMEQVEDQERDRPSRPARKTLAEGLVVGAAVQVHHDELPVEHRGPCRHPHGEPRELRELLPELRSPRVHDPDRAASGRRPGLDEREDAVPAPGGLEEPVGRVERVGEWGRPHGRHVAGARHRRLELEGELLGHRGSMVAPRPPDDRG